MIYHESEKLIKKLKSKPHNFTFDEAETILNYLYFTRLDKGKTSGSRVKFTSQLLMTKVTSLCLPCGQTTLFGASRIRLFA